MLALPVLFAFLLLPGPDFGQREHMLAMVLLPYFVVVASGHPSRISRPSRAALGIAAGIVIAFKPYFGLYLLLGEGILLLRRRDPRLLLRAEVIAIITVLASAVLGTVILFPEYLDFIVPLGREVYHGFEEPLAVVMTDAATYWTLALCVAALMIAARTSDSSMRDLVGTLVAAAAAALVIFVMQRKGWIYQALPALIFATIAVGASLVAALAAHAARRGGSLVAVAVAAAIVVLPGALLTYGAFVDSSRRAAEIRPLIDLVSQATPRRALFLSTHLPHAFPVVNYAGASWPYRYHHLLPLPGLYRGFDPRAAGAPFRRPDQMGPTEARFFATVVEDALRFPPQLILVDRGSQYAPLDDLRFDFVAYFRQHPQFARMMDGFRYAGRVSAHDVYVRSE
jgi:hypothetical protein